MNVSEFLVDRIENLGVKHIFGVPGDYVLKLYNLFSESKKLEVVNTTDEAHAGFAADAYGRVHGAGCVMVTYNVGALKIANAVACAYAERSPLIVISGSPGMNERQEGMLLHHMVGAFESQKEVFERWTCDQAVLTDPTTAGYQIDKVLQSMMAYKQPIYIELPRDVAEQNISYDVYVQETPSAPKSDTDSLEECLQEVYGLIQEAENPVILAGVELSRFGLGKNLAMFAEATNIPVATTLLSKSVVNEQNSFFAGVYMGSASQEYTKKLVEESDCLIMLGVMLTDMTLAFKPAVFKKKQTINVCVESTDICNHSYKNVKFDDFCDAFLRLRPTPKRKIELPQNRKQTFSQETGKKLKTARFFQKIDSILNDGMAVCVDVGDVMFGAADLTMHHSNHFICDAFYTSMGFSIPAALGVQTAFPKVRPIVLIGDGAFQMCFSEISTIANRGLNPIIFVLNNGGYSTERFLIDGPFNDINNWNYHKVGEIFGNCEGTVVHTEDELENAVKLAIQSKKVSVINVVVDKNDVSEPLLRMTAHLQEKI